jgi:Helicase associated domain/Glycosyl transferases group 1
MMVGLREAGASVLQVDTDRRREVLDMEGFPYRRGGDRPVWLRDEAVRQLLDDFPAHLVILNGGGLGLGPESAARVRERSCLLGVALSDPDVYEPSTSRYANLMDVFATNAVECVSRYEALGVPTLSVPLATDPSFFHPVEPREEHRCDVLLVGSAHRDRIDAIRTLSRHFDVRVVGTGWEEHGIDARPPISGKDLLVALSSATTTLIFNRTAGGHAVVKHWVFDCLAAGALVVTNEDPSLARHVEFGRHLVGFESPSDLVGIIRHYVENPQEANPIRAAARGRVLEGLSWQSQWPLFLEQIRTATERGADLLAWHSHPSIWSRGLESLAQYIRRTDHSNVPPAHIEGGFPIGRWVAGQRRRAIQDALQEEETRSLLTLNGWSWDPREAAWEQGFAELEAFVDREGHARPSPDLEPELARWVAAQQRAHRVGGLARWRRVRLERLRGWGWSPADAAWEQVFADLEAFVEREGHARPRPERDRELAGWVAAQRRAHRDGRLAAGRSERLERLAGWSWDPREAAWEQAFAALEAFIGREGHARVPAGHVEDGVGLGGWVAAQRRAYRDGRLAAGRSERLERLAGWSWDPEADAWEQGFAALEAFVEHEGHPRPTPSREPELAGWVAAQRRAYRAGALEPARSERLERLQGWSWDPREAAWEQAFAALEAFVEREGHARVARTHSEDGVALGMWVATQRYAHQHKRLEKDRAARLEGIPGWVWRARPESRGDRAPAGRKPPPRARSRS